MIKNKNADKKILQAFELLNEVMLQDGNLFDLDLIREVREKVFEIAEILEVDCGPASWLMTDEEPEEIGIY